MMAIYQTTVYGMPGSPARRSSPAVQSAGQFGSPIQRSSPAVACNLHLFIRLSIFACGIYNFVERKCRMKKADILVQRYQSPCGELVLGSYGDRLCLCNWTVEMHPGRVDRRLLTLLDTSFQESRTDITDEAVRQLSEYFSGDRKTFDIPLLFAGTDFQKKVWRGLLEIPYGTTVSYGELAAATGVPKSVRAVANANGANAISIFVPCHRVIGHARTLAGYGGGLDAKKFLLDLESHSAASVFCRG